MQTQPNEADNGTDSDQELDSGSDSGGEAYVVLEDGDQNLTIDNSIDWARTLEGIYLNPAHVRVMRDLGTLLGPNPPDELVADFRMRQGVFNKMGDVDLLYKVNLALGFHYQNTKEFIQLSNTDRRVLFDLSLNYLLNRPWKVDFFAKLNLFLQHFFHTEFLDWLSFSVPKVFRH